jgi:hypothetical protein
MRRHRGHGRLDTRTRLLILHARGTETAAEQVSSQGGPSGRTCRGGPSLRPPRLRGARDASGVSAREPATSPIRRTGSSGRVDPRARRRDTRHTHPSARCRTPADRCPHSGTTRPPAHPQSAARRLYRPRPATAVSQTRPWDPAHVRMRTTGMTCRSARTARRMMPAATHRDNTPFRWHVERSRGSASVGRPSAIRPLRRR